MLFFDPALTAVSGAAPAAAASGAEPGGDAAAFGELFMEAIGIPAGVVAEADGPAASAPRAADGDDEREAPVDEPAADEDATELLAWIVAPQALSPGTAEAAPYEFARGVRLEADRIGTAEAVPYANIYGSVEAPPTIFDRGVRLQADQVGTAEAMPYANVEGALHTFDRGVRLEADQIGTAEAAPYANVEAVPPVFDRGGRLQADQIGTAEAVPYASMEAASCATVEAKPDANSETSAFALSWSRRAPLQGRREIVDDSPWRRLDADGPLLEDSLNEKAVTAAAAKMLARQVARAAHAEAASDASPVSPRISELVAARDTEMLSRFDEASRTDVDVAPAPAFNAHLLSRLAIATDVRTDVTMPAGSSGVVATPMPAAPTPLADDVIAPQIVRSMRLIAQDDGGEARVRLKPEYLGEVVIVVKVDGGRVTASVQAESPAVRHWAETHEHVLRQGLGAHGLRLDELTIQAPAEPSAPDRQADDGTSEQREQPPARRRPRNEEEPERFEVVL